MKFYPNVFFKIFKSSKILIYILLNFCLTTVAFVAINSFLTNQLNDFYTLKVTSIFGIAIYYLSLGILLWFFIMFEIIKLFRINDDNGIMLTQITKPISRKQYYLQLTFAVYLVFVIVSIINIILSLLACIIVFQTFSINLVLMTLSGIVFSFIHVAYIVVIMAFLAIVINQTEISIFISSIVCLALYGLSLVGYFVSQANNLLYKLYAIIVMHETNVFLFIVDKIFYPFAVNINNNAIVDKTEVNNFLYFITGFDNFVRKDLDLNFSPKLPFLLDSLFNILFFVLTIGIIYLVAKLSIKQFENNDITGN